MGGSINRFPAQMPQRNESYRSQVSRGVVAGVGFIQKYGEAPDIDIADNFLTVWDNKSIYVPPTQGRIHDVVSDDIADVGTLLSSGTMTDGGVDFIEDTGATFVSDGVAVGDVALDDDCIAVGIVTSLTEIKLDILGLMRDPENGKAIICGSTDAYRIVTNGSTGASIAYIAGINTLRLDQEEFVILNGTTNVPTANSYFRQHRARVFGANTTGLVGVLTSTAQTDGTISLQIIDGNNQTLMAVYTVPIDKDGFITNWWTNLAGNTVAISNVILWVGLMQGIGYIVQKVALNSSGDSSFVTPESFSKSVPGGADIWITADSSSNNAIVSAGFDVELYQVR